VRARVTDRLHLVLYAAIIARTIQEVCDRRDRQREKAARGCRTHETWRDLESFRWLRGERGQGLAFADLCDALGWNARAIWNRLNQPDRLLGSWRLPHEVLNTLNAHHALFGEHELEEHDVLHGVPGIRAVWQADPVITVQRAIGRMVAEYELNGPVRTLDDMTPDEQLKVCKRYWDRGEWVTVEPRFFW
jgi:hypothetical protein